MFVLIVTASVPTLQPLFRKALRMRSTVGYASYSLRPTPKAKPSGRSRGAIYRGFEYPDGTTMNPSTDHILPIDLSHPGDVKPGIVKTNDFSVIYNSSP